MNLISYTNAKSLAEELGKLSSARPDFANYDSITTPSHYYLWLHDKKIETFKGETSLSSWRKVTLVEIVKLGNALFNSIELANLPTYLFFFTLLQDHFAEKSRDPLIDTISFIDRVNARIKREAATPPPRPTLKV